MDLLCFWKQFIPMNIDGSINNFSGQLCWKRRGLVCTCQNFLANCAPRSLCCRSCRFLCTQHVLFIEQQFFRTASLFAVDFTTRGSTCHDRYVVDREGFLHPTRSLQRTAILSHGQSLCCRHYYMRFDQPRPLCCRS